MPICLVRPDHFYMYNIQDTLLMLTTPICEQALSKLPELSLPFYEKVGDYTTIQMSYSILKLSNCYVSGVILRGWWEEIVENMSIEERLEWLENLTDEERKSIKFWIDVPYRELQKILLEEIKK